MCDRARSGGDLQYVKQFTNNNQEPFPQFKPLVASATCLTRQADLVTISAPRVAA